VPRNLRFSLLIGKETLRFLGTGRPAIVEMTKNENPAELAPWDFQTRFKNLTG
jgi:hypothetical protein